MKTQDALHYTGLEAPDAQPVAYTMSGAITARTTTCPSPLRTR
jgi:hypothetical protein